MPDLAPAVATIIERCLAVKAGEEVLVVADPGTRTIGEALRDAAAGAGSDAVLAVMDARAENGNEPPQPVAAAMLAANVYIAPTTKSISHTAARKRASEAGVRGATMPGVTDEMLARVMAVDFDRMASRSRAVAALLTDADDARLTCPRGSDFRIDLRGRKGRADDGDLAASGAFGNLPCGEGFIAPLNGDGTIVASSLASIGLTAQPTVITVEGGRIASAEGGVGPEFLERLTAYGEPGRNLAELGVGTNDRATVTGMILEDEKILGTVHVAFGASAAIGGTVAVPVHLDAVVLEATLDVGPRRVLDAGRYVLDGQ
ncbi:MAG TPA: aminopeptidase [Candidatus Limnocylindria bacterium]|nr:aminopeptidase [Candidatus Limnocylindria bacterium]